jgi:hypothetical protein
MQWNEKKCFELKEIENDSEREVAS